MEYTNNCHIDRLYDTLYLFTLIFPVLGKDYIELIHQCFDENIKEKDCKRVALSGSEHEISQFKSNATEDRNQPNSFNIFNNYFKSDDSENKRNP